jgi:hypothetical protein
MSADNTEQNKKDATISSTDDLVKTGESGHVQLSGEEMKRVTGGSLILQRKSSSHHRWMPKTPLSTCAAKVDERSAQRVHSNQGATVMTTQPKRVEQKVS